MAYKIIAEYVRPDTGVEFPKTSDHNSDYYTRMRDYYTNNGIALSFDLSEDELKELNDRKLHYQKSYHSSILG